MPTITIELEEDVNRLVELFKAAKNIDSKEKAINEIIKQAKASIMKEVSK